MYEISQEFKVRLHCNMFRCFSDLETGSFRDRCRWLMIAQEGGLNLFIVCSRTKNERFVMHIARIGFANRRNFLAICNRLMCFDEVGVGDM